MRHIALAVMVTASACGQKEDKRSAKSSPPTCDALAASAAEARALRDQVSSQLAAVDHAMNKFEQWSKKLVTPEQDGGGDYSGAGQRAFSYKRTATALCKAALSVDEGMLQFARQWAEPADVSSAEDVFPRLTCLLKAQPDGPPDVRRATTIEWSSQSRDARDFEDRLMQTCSNKSTSKRADYHLTPISLPDE